MRLPLWASLYVIVNAGFSLAAPATTPSYVISAIASQSSVEKYSASVSSASVASLITASPKPQSFKDIVPEILIELPPILTNAIHTLTDQSNKAPSVTATLPPATTAPLFGIGDYQFHPHREIQYSVPHTQTNLSIVLANPGQVPSINPQAMAQTILSLRSTIQSRINDTGDRWLDKEEDPYGWDLNLGCWLEFWSSPDDGPNGKKQHLTLGILKATLDGLVERLVYKGLYDFAYVEIYDSQWGLTGRGIVAPTELSSARSNEILSTLTTLKIEGKR